MRQEEKTRLTCEKILNVAIMEFGTKSYENASLNTICSENGISKGLVYHNFKSKDEIYLRCVEICFREMTEYLCNAEYKAKTVQDSMRNLLHLRQRFFQENPYYSNIFFYALLQPPKHLLPQIREIRRQFDEFYADCCKELLSQIELREGITVDMAMEYFIVFQEMFNGYFQSKSYEKTEFHTLVKDHEMNLSKMLDIMLYGVAKEEYQP